MKEHPIRLRDILMHPETIPDGWLYLPQPPWTLETIGIFADDEGDPSPDPDEDIPAQAKAEGWAETLESAAIEDVIDNLRYRSPEPTAEERLEAFVFYFENDAFIVR